MSNGGVLALRTQNTGGPTLSHVAHTQLFKVVFVSEFQR